ncbi:prolyl oligopeptidase family-domain-containing protein [Entophlyctis helioformis]|nr:prolyl oligopeptidase family-domain-containing protein [Entophlyctis helioformis]
MLWQARSLAFRRAHGSSLPTLARLGSTEHKLAGTQRPSLKLLVQHRSALSSASSAVERSPSQRRDEWRWLQDLSSHQTLQFLAQERARTASLESGLAPHVQRLQREMRMYMPAQHPRPPQIIAGSYEYRTDYEHGATLLKRRRIGSLEDAALDDHAPFETLLDSRWLGSGRRASTLGKVLVSDDHSTLAYVSVRPQDEQGTLHIRRLSGSNLMGSMKRLLPTTVFNFVWAADSKTIYFTRLDDALRSLQVVRISIESPHQETVVYTEPDPAFFVDLARSKDKDTVYALHNHHSPELRLTCATLHDNNLSTTASQSASLVLSREATVIAEPQAGERIDEVELFERFAVLYMRANGCPFLRIVNLADLTTRNIKVPEHTCSISPGTSQDIHANTLSFSYQSPFMVDAHCDLDLDSGRLRTNGYARPVFPVDRFVVRQTHAVASDGTHIPVTVIHRKDKPVDVASPCILLAYGAYGLPLETGFRLEILPALSRGVVVAYAHVRGGGDLGLQWHRQGRGINKPNSFSDLEAVADMLINSSIAMPGRLGGIGTSAGGMLFAAVMNRRPDLFKALLLRVPFLDPLTSMLDPNSPLTAGESIEWGVPAADQHAYASLASYAPYDNIHSVSLPHGLQETSVLATTGDQDQRVPPWHALKFVARLRHGRDYPAYFKLYKERGHVHAGDSSERLDEWALEMAFLLRELDCL